MIKRDENGNLQYDILSLQIVINNLFANCINEQEVEIINEELAGLVSICCETRLDELLEDENESDT